MSLMDAAEVFPRSRESRYLDHENGLCLVVLWLTKIQSFENVTRQKFNMIKQAWMWEKRQNGGETVSILGDSRGRGHRWDMLRE